MVTANEHRVLMLGLDSAEISFIKKHLDQFPNLYQLSQQGCFQGLKNYSDYMSACVWSTFYTGLPPGEHGFYYPMQWNPETMQLRRVLQDWFYLEPFWYELAREGYPVTAVDIQTQFPSRTPLGKEITNWGSQSYLGGSSNPPELIREVNKKFGKHPMGHDVVLPKNERQSKKILQEIFAGLQTRGQLFSYMMTETDWKLFLGVFTETHRGGHYFWPYDEDDTRLLSIVQAVDAEIGKLLKLVDMDKTTVIIFSLHGMSENRTQMHFLPQIMDRINIAFSHEDKTYPDNHQNSLTSKGLMRTLRENLPTNIQYLIADNTPDSVRDWVVNRQFIGALDWSKTRGFVMPSGSEGYIRLNLKGRERDGCLTYGSEEYQQYCDFIVKCFNSLKVDETGESVVEKITFSQDTFAGAKSHLLPDIIVSWKGIEPVARLKSDILGTMNGELQTGRGGNHWGDEGFILTGGNVTEDAQKLNNIAQLAGFVKNLVRNNSVSVKV